MYWCPHCSKIIDNSSNIREEEVCACGHPYICPCRSDVDMFYFEEKEFPLVEREKDMFNVSYKAENKTVRLLSLKDHIDFMEAEILLNCEFDLLCYNGNEVLNRLVNHLKNEKVLSTKEYWDILMPENAESAYRRRARILLNLLYTLRRKKLITEDDFDYIIYRQADDGPMGEIGGGPYLV